MTRKRFIPLIIGVILLGLGVGLIFYGITLPPNFIVGSFILPLLQTEINILVLFGIPLVSIGIAFLLFWFFTRSKEVKP